MRRKQKRTRTKKNSRKGLRRSKRTGKFIRSTTKKRRRRRNPNRRRAAMNRRRDPRTGLFV